MNLTQYNKNIENYCLCIYFFYSSHCLNIYMIKLKFRNFPSK